MAEPIKVVVRFVRLLGDTSSFHEFPDTPRIGEHIMVNDRVYLIEEALWSLDNDCYGISVREATNVQIGNR